MPEKPATAAEYSKERVERVKRTCLYVATILGDYMKEAVIVGGLVQSLLIDQNNLPDGAGSHVGTMDLDIGLTLAILDEKRYQAITDRLRSADFSPDVNEQGNPTRQRWKIEKVGKVTIDFLIPPVGDDNVGGRIKDMGQDFAETDSVGAVRAARFMTGGTNEEIQADVAGFVRSLLDLCKPDEI